MAVVDEIDALAAVDGVGRGAGNDPVVTRLCEDLLELARGACFEMDEVVAGAAEDGVVSGSGVDDVIAGVAVQAVVTLVAEQGVVAERAFQPVVAESADEYVGQAAAEQRVVAGDAIDVVGLSRDAAEIVVAWGADDNGHGGVSIGNSIDDRLVLPERF